MDNTPTDVKKPPGHVTGGYLMVCSTTARSITALLGVPAAPRQKDSSPRVTPRSLGSRGATAMPDNKTAVLGDLRGVPSLLTKSFTSFRMVVPSATLSGTANPEAELQGFDRKNNCSLLVTNHPTKPAGQ